MTLCVPKRIFDADFKYVRFFLAHRAFEIQYPPTIRGCYVPSLPANSKNSQIIDAVLKRPGMILYTLKCASLL